MLTWRRTLVVSAIDLLAGVVGALTIYNFCGPFRTVMEASTMPVTTILGFGVAGVLVGTTQSVVSAWSALGAALVATVAAVLAWTVSYLLATFSAVMPVPGGAPSLQPSRGEVLGAIARWATFVVAVSAANLVVRALRPAH